MKIALQKSEAGELRVDVEIWPRKKSRRSTGRINFSFIAEVLVGLVIFHLLPKYFGNRTTSPQQ